MCRKNLWELVKAATGNQTRPFFKKIAYVIPVHKVRRLTPAKKLQHIGRNAKQYEKTLGKHLPNGIKSLTESPMFKRVAGDDRAVNAVVSKIGDKESAFVEATFRPWVESFFPGSMRKIIGETTIADFVLSFSPAPGTNLYLSEYNGKLVPRNEWRRFWYGKKVVVPRGRPTDRQRIIDGLLIAIGAGTPAALADTILTVSGLLFAKEIWRLIKDGHFAGSPPAGGPILDNGDATSVLTVRDAVKMINETEAARKRRQPRLDGFNMPDMGNLRNLMLDQFGYTGQSGWTPMNERLLRASWHRAVHVHCEACGYDAICSEAHAAISVVYLGEDNPYFPCPACNARAPDALLVLSPCTLSIIYLDTLRAVLFNII